MAPLPSAFERIFAEILDSSNLTMLAVYKYKINIEKHNSKLLENWFIRQYR